ncbi:MAG: toll/interleukin-1 receptor domain-containing protein [Planctomycetes bacterium]|nr:toll/interleukin-1 receptor domain-containing protein [Planctomycetota bacterium]
MPSKQLLETRKRFFELTVDAFDLSELEEVASFDLGTPLNQIAGNGSLRDKVFALIGWAEREGRLVELAHSLAARRQNRGDLAAVVKDLVALLETGAIGGFSVAAARPVQPDIPTSPPAANPPSGGDNAERPEIFVSFAWGDDRSPAGIDRQQAVDRLCAKLPEWGYQVRRDCQEIRYGDLISAYMRRLGRADRVLVILSEKYLRSPFCMAELHYIYQRSLGQADEFHKRIIPVALADAHFSTPEERLDHAKYWHGRREKLKADWEFLGTSDQRLLKEMQRWSQEVGDMLAYINDRLIPRTFDDICRDDFRALREMLGALRDQASVEPGVAKGAKRKERANPRPMASDVQPESQASKTGASEAGEHDVRQLSVAQGTETKGSQSNRPSTATIVGTGDHPPSVGRPRIYISYTWRTKGLKPRALKLAEKLRDAGIDARIDLFYAKSLYGFTPPDPVPGRDSWEVWQEEQVEAADCVLLICTPEYFDSPPETGASRDLQFMQSDLESGRAKPRKFIPVGFGSHKKILPYIPAFVDGATYYDLNSGASDGFTLDDLVRRLKSEFK